MAVIKQVTSKLQAMKQWNLYFSFLMVFIGRESAGLQKDSLLVSLNTFDF